MSKKKGITNFEIEKTKKTENDHHKINFLAVFLSNQFNKFTGFSKFFKSRQLKYSFLISKTDRSDKFVTHWWSILDIHPRNANLY